MADEEGNSTNPRTPFNFSSSIAIPRALEKTGINPPIISKARGAAIIANVSCITFMSSISSGIMVISLSTIADDIGISDNLMTWPSSVANLACGCTLLLFGSICDIVGARIIYLTGTFTFALATMAAGLSKTGIMLILFRTAQGPAMAMCLVASTKLLTQHIPVGLFRNTAFSCLGAAQPVGFGVGLLVGGCLIETVGWRYGFYILAAISLIVFICSIFQLREDPLKESRHLADVGERLRNEIDWVGCFLISTSLGLASYVFSVLASGIVHFLTFVPLALGTFSILFLGAFLIYGRVQENQRRKIIIPPSIWSNAVFTSFCITVFLVWSSFNAMQYFITLFFETVQELSAFQAALRFTPLVVTGLCTNLIAGGLVKHVPANILILISGLITAVGSLLMAIVDLEWSYWRAGFPALAAIPICADLLFTVANLVITTVFPPQTHGLASGVFNTISSIANSVGLAIAAVISTEVTLSKNKDGSKDPIADLMAGYRAIFWVCFGANVLVLVIAGFGLRNIGKVGGKSL